MEEDIKYHKKSVHGHTLYYEDGCEDGLRYLLHDLDSSASRDFFKAAKNDSDGFDFESRKKRQEYKLTYERRAGRYTLNRRDS